MFFEMAEGKQIDFKFLIKQDNIVLTKSKPDQMLAMLACHNKLFNSCYECKLECKPIMPKKYSF